MAALTKAELRNRVLQHLGVLGSGQSAQAADAALVDEAIDAAHSTLSKQALVPFAISAVPEWAQVPLRDYVAGDVAQSFGYTGARFVELKSGQSAGERALSKQVAGFNHNVRTSPEFF